MVKPYYDEDGVTIYHGDCAEVLPAVDSVDLVLADPPYGVRYESNWTTGPGGARTIANDGARLALRVYRRVIPLLKAEHVLWFTRWDAWPDVWELLGQTMPIRGLLVWDKGGSPGMGDLKHWGPSYELIASAGYGQTGGKREGSILRFPRVSNRRLLHPAEKPIPLLAYLIEKLEAQTVLDPFMGSGAALVAARACGCRAIGIEIEERYCEIAVQRLAQEVLDVAV